jgi:hypothetical protein
MKLDNPYHAPACVPVLKYSGTINVLLVACQIAGLVVAVFLASVAGWLFNQELQFIPTKTVTLLQSIDGIPVSNYGLGMLLSVASIFSGLVSFVSLVVQQRKVRMRQEQSKVLGEPIYGHTALTTQRMTPPPTTTDRQSGEGR